MVKRADEGKEEGTREEAREEVARGGCTVRARNSARGLFLLARFGFGAGEVSGTIGAMRPKGRPLLGLALGGGGARGLAHLGVLMALEEAELRPEVVAGTSMGAIVGGLYAAGQDLPQLVQLLEHLDLGQIFGVPASYERVVEQAVVEALVGRLRRRPWWEESSPRLSRLLEFLRLLGKNQWFEDLPVPFVAVAADMATGEEVRIDEGALHLGIAASAALPGLFGPVKWRKRYLIDGGVVNNLPIDVVEMYGPQEILAVDVSAPLGPMPHNLVEVALRAYQITAQELERVKLAEAQKRLGERLFVIHPEVDDIGLLEFRKLRQAIEAGREAARSALRYLLS